SADRVVGLFQSVDRERDLADARLHRALNAPFVHLAGAGDDAAQHAEARDLACDDVPVLAQVELAADQRDLLDAEVGELAYEIKRLGRGELIASRAARARSAMLAAEVAAKRDLPDRDAWRGLLMRPPADQAGGISVVDALPGVVSH